MTVSIAREEMRLPERKKALFLTSVEQETNTPKAFRAFLCFQPRFLLRTANGIELWLPIAPLASKFHARRPFPWNTSSNTQRSAFSHRKQA